MKAGHTILLLVARMPRETRFAARHECKHIELWRREPLDTDENERVAHEFEVAHGSAA
jgi:hypothetical protein